MCAFARKRNKRFNAVIRPRRQRRRAALPRFSLAGRIPPLAVVGGFVAFVGLTALVGILFFSGQFSPTDVVVKGVSAETLPETRQRVDAFLAERSFGVLPRSTVLFPTSSLQRALADSFPRFKQIEVGSELPHTLRISVVERERDGIWCPAQSQGTPRCFFYGEDGVIFEEAPNNARGFLLRFVRDERMSGAQLGQQVLTEEDLTDLELVYAAFSHVFEQPSYVVLVNEREIRAGFLPNWEARLSRADEFLPQVDNVALVVQEQIGTRRGELEYIDARLGSRLFYKYRTTEAPQEVQNEEAESSQPTETEEEGG